MLPKSANIRPAYATSQHENYSKCSDIFVEYCRISIEGVAKSDATNHESIKYMQTIFFLKIVETKKQWNKKKYYILYYNKR